MHPMKQPQRKLKLFITLTFVSIAGPLLAVTAAQCLSMYLIMESESTARYQAGQITVIQWMEEREFNRSAYTRCMEDAIHYQ